jgi:hypothetical protein
LLLLVCVTGCGGSSGDKPLTYKPVSATTDGTFYTLTMGDLKMVVDGSHGARITEFSLRGKSVLVTADENINYGATYWPSPQASWCTGGVDCWPPPDAIDSGTYMGSIDVDNSITLVGNPQTLATIPGAQLVVTKFFTPVPDSGAVDVKYVLANLSTSTASITAAPWQVSRVEAAGLTFFGPGTGDVTYAANTAPTFMVNEAAGARWYTSAPVSHDSKALSDGAGWIAHVTPDTAHLLFVVSYTDIPAASAAPGEAEVELFTNSSYVEIEPQGPYTVLAPDDTLEWTVRWKLRPVPGGTMVAEGNADLVSLATTTLAE